EMVFTRHRAIAEVALDILKNTTRYPIEPDELYVDLVRTAQELRMKGEFVIALGKWRYSLPDYFLEKGDQSLAIKLVQSLVQADSTDSYLRVKLSELFRKAGQPEQSLKAFRDAPRPDDDRAFFHEWAVAEGEQDNLALDAWLDAVALADDTARRPPSNKDGVIYLAGFAFACRELFRAYNSWIFMEGCGAASDLGLVLPYLNPKTKRFLSETQATAWDAGVERVSPAEALRRIQAAALAAYDQREAELQDWVQPAPELAFEGLKSLVDSVQ
ncbi:MAG: hypothetical protein KJO08_08040, partial [Gammaproteobacteria bacterium]|nr:hypothetical protein [Gammaproteobacteria bacterium]NNJ83593.1 hypothetical protein [Gammaproteobacteria bacterium]